MSSVFMTVLNMSVTAAFVIVALILARLVLQKLRAPKWISYALWAVSGFRLAVPFALESALSLIPFNASPIPQNIAMQSVPRIDSGISVIDNAIIASLPAATPTASVNPLQIWTAIGAYVWLLGVGVMLIYAVVSYVRLMRNKDGAGTPFVYGFIKPKIHIPSGISGEKLRYVTLHEQTHIKRRDHLVKLFAYALLCVHWFNPFAWLAFVLLCADMEMSCDERVLRELGMGAKADYSQALLSLSMNRRILGASPLAFGEGGVKERVKNVLNFKKRSRVIVLAAVALLAAVSVGFAVNRANVAAKAVYKTPEAAFAALSKYLPNVVTENLSFIRENTGEDDGTLWLWYNADREADGLTHKLEVVENDGVICRYRYKNYYIDIPENTIDLNTSSVMALDFAYDFIPESALTFENRPYGNNIYDPGLVESWVAKSAAQNVEYVIMVNMVYGYIEQYTIEPAQPSQHELDYHITSDGLEIPNLFAVPSSGDTNDAGRFLQFGYSWTIDNGDGTGVSGVADSIAPWGGEYHPVNTLEVDGGETFVLTCPEKLEIIAYRVYAEDGGIYEDGASGGNTIIAPSDKGVYYYEIEARFAENDLRVNYAIRIIVKPDVYMTLNDVRDLSLGLGEDLTWKDLNGFIGMEVGSGLYIMLYDIEGGDYHLKVGSLKPDAPIEYAYFAHVDSEFAEDKRIDIRYYDVDAFLAGEKKPIARNAVPPQFAPTSGVFDIGFGAEGGPKYPDSTITAHLANFGDVDIYCGEMFTIEKQTGGSWIDVPLDVAFIEPLYTLKNIANGGESKAYVLRPEYLAKPLTPGWYRFVTRISVDNVTAAGSLQMADVYVTFYISDKANLTRFVRSPIAAFTSDARLLHGGKTRQDI